MKYCCIKKNMIAKHLRHWQGHEANYTRDPGDDWFLVRKEVVMSSVIMELVCG